MKKKFIFILLSVAILVFILLFLNFKKTDSTITTKPTFTINSSLPKRGDKIEIYAFHSTQRCLSCINISKFIKSLLETKYSKELSLGLIVFKEINIDLTENQQLANDYQASASSLFITVTKDGQSFKEQDTDVWRYVAYENKFKSYFEAKLKYLL